MNVQRKIICERLQTLISIRSKALSEGLRLSRELDLSETHLAAGRSLALLVNSMENAEAHGNLDASMFGAKYLNIDDVHRACLEVRADKTRLKYQKKLKDNLSRSPIGLVQNVIAESPTAIAEGSIKFMDAIREQMARPPVRKVKQDVSPPLELHASGRRPPPDAPPKSVLLAKTQRQQQDEDEQNDDTAVFNAIMVETLAEAKRRPPPNGPPKSLLNPKFGAKTAANNPSPGQHDWQASTSEAKNLSVNRYATPKGYFGKKPTAYTLNTVVAKNPPTNTTLVLNNPNLRIRKANATPPVKKAQSQFIEERPVTTSPPSSILSGQDKEEFPLPSDDADELSLPRPEGKKKEPKGWFASLWGGDNDEESSNISVVPPPPDGEEQQEEEAFLDSNALLDYKPATIFSNSLKSPGISLKESLRSSSAKNRQIHLTGDHAEQREHGGDIFRGATELADSTSQTSIVRTIRRVEVQASVEKAGVTGEENDHGAQYKEILLQERYRNDTLVNYNDPNVNLNYFPNDDDDDDDGFSEKTTSTVKQANLFDPLAQSESSENHYETPLPAPISLIHANIDDELNESIVSIEVHDDDNDHPHRVIQEERNFQILGDIIDDEAIQDNNNNSLSIDHANEYAPAVPIPIAATAAAGQSLLSSISSFTSRDTGAPSFLSMGGTEHADLYSRSLPVLNSDTDHMDKPKGSHLNSVRNRGDGSWKSDRRSVVNGSLIYGGVENENDQTMMVYGHNFEIGSENQMPSVSAHTSDVSHHSESFPSSSSSSSTARTSNSRQNKLPFASLIKSDNVNRAGDNAANEAFSSSFISNMEADQKKHSDLAKLKNYKHACKQQQERRRDDLKSAKSDTEYQMIKGLLLEHINDFVPKISSPRHFSDHSASHKKTLRDLHAEIKDFYGDFDGASDSEDEEIREMSMIRACEEAAEREALGTLKAPSLERAAQLRASQSVPLSRQHFFSSMLEYSRAVQASRELGDTPAHEFRFASKVGHLLEVDPEDPSRVIPSFAHQARVVAHYQGVGGVTSEFTRKKTLENMKLDSTMRNSVLDPALNNQTLPSSNLDDREILQEVKLGRGYLSGVCRCGLCEFCLARIRIEEEHQEQNYLFQEKQNEKNFMIQKASAAFENGTKRKVIDHSKHLKSKNQNCCRCIGGVLLSRLSDLITVDAPLVEDEAYSRLEEILSLQVRRLETRAQNLTLQLHKTETDLLQDPILAGSLNARPASTSARHLIRVSRRLATARETEIQLSLAFQLADVDLKAWKPSFSKLKADIAKVKCDLVDTTQHIAFRRQAEFELGESRRTPNCAILDALSKAAHRSNGQFFQPPIDDSSVDKDLSEGNPHDGAIGTSVGSNDIRNVRLANILDQKRKVEDEGKNKEFYGVWEPADGLPFRETINDGLLGISRRWEAEKKGVLFGNGYGGGISADNQLLEKGDRHRLDSLLVGKGFRNATERRASLGIRSLQEIEDVCVRLNTERINNDSRIEALGRKLSLITEAEKAFVSNSSNRIMKSADEIMWRERFKAFNH